MLTISHVTRETQIRQDDSTRCLKEYTKGTGSHIASVCEDREIKGCCACVWEVKMAAILGVWMLVTKVNILSSYDLGATLLGI